MSGQLGTAGVKKRQQEEFLRSVGSLEQVLSLFDWLPDAHLYIKDYEGRFMAINTASARRNGFDSPDEIIGLTDFEVHPPQMAAAYREEDLRVMAGRKAIPEQVWLVYDYLGAQKWFVSTKVPLFGADNEVVGIAGIMRPLSESRSLRGSYEGLAPAVEKVLADYGEPLRVEELAGMVELSASQFGRRFRKLFGLSPGQFLLKVRINAARTLLARSEKALGEVALECGFYDQGQFGRMFRRELGMTPGEYRRRYRV